MLLYCLITRQDIASYLLSQSAKGLALSGDLLHERTDDSLRQLDMYCPVQNLLVPSYVSVKNDIVIALMWLP